MNNSQTNITNINNMDKKGDIKKEKKKQKNTDTQSSSSSTPPQPNSSDKNVIIPILQLSQELESGNIEYKLKLVDPPPTKFEHLVSQLKWRLAEGCGEALYEIGVSDRGELIGLNQEDLEASLATLQRMGEALNADMSIMRELVVPNAITTSSSSTDNQTNKVVEVMFRRRLTDDHFLEIRVAILGGLDAGKSTLLGVLTHGDLDNGRGKSRLNLLRHRHEIETGRTSSISHQIIGFSASGTLINYASTNIATWEQICETAAKIVTFLDTCGHPKYLKTTISGLTGRAPDFACLLVGANAGGISDMTREHMALSIMLKVPVFIVMTKIDISTAEQLTKTMEGLLSLLKSPGMKRLPVVIQNEDDIMCVVTPFINQSAVPIFLTSSVSGENIHLLTHFLNLLPKPVKNHDKFYEEELEVQIEETYSIPDVGPVVGGILHAGHLSVDQPSPLRTGTPTRVKHFIGPDALGQFFPIRIESIHRQRIPVRFVRKGEGSTFAFRFLMGSSGSVLSGGYSESKDKDKMIGKRKRSLSIHQQRVRESDTMIEPKVTEIVTSKPTTNKKGRVQSDHEDMGNKANNSTTIETKPIPTKPRNQLPRGTKYGSGNSGRGENAGTFFWGSGSGGSGSGGNSAQNSLSPGMSLSGVMASNSSKRVSMSLAEEEDTFRESDHSSDSDDLDLPLKLRKGQVILSSTHPSLRTTGDSLGTSIATCTSVSMMFEAELNVLYHPNALVVGCGGVVFIGSVRQGVRVMKVERLGENEEIGNGNTEENSNGNGKEKEDSKPTDTSEPSGGGQVLDSWLQSFSEALTPESPDSSLSDSNPAKQITTSLKTGERGRVVFRFLNEPEFLKKGWTVLFRDGEVKCVGKVVSVG